MRPLIAISATAEDAKVRLSLNYVRSIEGAGLLPVIVPPLADPGTAAALIAGCSGLLLTGGEDVDPARYGAPAHATTGAPNVPRDATELALFAAARERGIPVLGICRGIQLINVAMGGTLVQDLPSERPSSIQHDQPDAANARTHGIRLVAKSRIHAAVNTDELVVNSYHHQAVDRLADGLTVTATAPDGVIEGVEGTEGPWLVAVQWHPEDLTTDIQPWDRGLFKAFREAVAGG
jgi:putative glutamine amidotransferase